MPNEEGVVKFLPRDLEHFKDFYSCFWITFLGAFYLGKMPNEEGVG